LGYGAGEIIRLVFHIELFRSCLVIKPEFAAWNKSEIAIRCVSTSTCRDRTGLVTLLVWLGVASRRSKE
jgi:hypothetical protein